jgi:meromycolic acid (3R)-3-hydroxyacyl-[acyl-carrier protein] dehydratase HadAB
VSARVRFDDARVGDQIPERSRIVTREDVRRYAEASGDANPLHQDEAVARAAGFPGVIAHGMFTMGHLASCVTEWLGDAGALRRMRVAFRSAVQMGDRIVAGGRIRSLDAASKTATLEVWVRVERAGEVERSDHEFAIRRSEALVRLA